MGYYIFSFGVQLNAILDTFGSKNDALQKKVEANDLFENYADFEVKGFHTHPKKALNDLFQGDPYDEKSNYAYGYAVIGIAATLGHELPYQQEIKLGYETDLINQVLSEDFSLNNIDIEEALFAENSHSFPIPKIDDWPLIGLITYDELVLLKQKLANIHITNEQIEALEDDPDEKEFAYEHIQGIIKNIDYCIANQLDLISFCH